MTVCNSFGKANVVQISEEEVQPVLGAMSIGAGMHLVLFLRAERGQVQLQPTGAARTYADRPH